MRLKDCFCKTNGKGLWSRTATTVKVTKVEISFLSFGWGKKEGDRHGELRAYFAIKNWDPNENGLIYTDPQWIADFRKYLREQLGFSDKASRDADYSEQGMQGDNYVSLDIGEKFVSEWEKLGFGKVACD